MLTSSDTSDVVTVGTGIILTCTLVFNLAIVASDVSLLMVDTQLSRDGTLLTLTGPTVTGATITFTTQFNSFGKSDSGNYTCTATVAPQPSAIYLTGNETVQSNTVNIRAGMWSLLS